MRKASKADFDNIVSSIERGNFEWIVEQHQKRIFSMLLFLTKNEDAAETLTQECFLKAFIKRHSFRGESSLGTWLMRIALNLAYDHKRSRRWAFWRGIIHTDRIESIQAQDTRRSPEQVLMDSESVAVVRTAVEKLSSRQKMVFFLRFVEELPLQTIAEVMDLKVGTVKAHLSRAIQSIRNAFDRQRVQGKIGEAYMENKNARVAE